MNIMAPEPWVMDAICPQLDPELFFPEKGNQAHNARKVCLQCPVRAECLDFAIRTNQQHGVYGGFSDRDRDSLKRGRNPLRRGRPGGAHTDSCPCVVCRRAA